MELKDLRNPVYTAEVRSITGIHSMELKAWVTTNPVLVLDSIRIHSMELKDSGLCLALPRQYMTIESI